ncbi:MAG: hypothetical protein AYK18_08045 [Theionarchaea archaeon DG-70]|nr:MAG: hypothetical protein AYK18_08045 [Theionarchaea archaeon DG-70]
MHISAKSVDRLSTFWLALVEEMKNPNVQSVRREKWKNSLLHSGLGRVMQSATQVALLELARFLEMTDAHI